MFLSLATKLFGSSNERILKSLYKHVGPINALEQRYAAMTDTELQAQTGLFRERLAKGESLDKMTHEAFAVVREAAKRTLGQSHFDVQLVGGMALHTGNIAEMRTGIDARISHFACGRPERPIAAGDSPPAHGARAGVRDFSAVAADNPDGDAFLVLLPNLLKRLPLRHLLLQPNEATARLWTSGRLSTIYLHEVL